MTFLQDPRFTFDTFVVGPGSRMAAAAARRAAESPGTSYNPLFVYGGPGVGKTHLLHAVGTLALVVRPDLGVLYQTAEEMVDALTSAVSAGALEPWRDRYLDVGLVLLDDVQFLAGKTRTQEELLRLWDEIDRGGAQIVLAGDRPPVEIGELDESLRSRLAGGLTVDIASPEADTRAEMVRRRVEEGSLRLAPGVPEVLAGLPFDGAHPLEVALERISERQKVAGRLLTPGEVREVFEPEVAAPAVPDEFSAFLSDIAFTVEQLVEAAPWRRTLAEAILRWEGEGVRTRRLESALETDSAPDVGALIERFGEDVRRLRVAAEKIRALDPRADENPLLSDPDRVVEAEALLHSLETAAAKAAASPEEPVKETGPAVDRWFFNREKLAWSWVALDERLIEEIG
ncbi:MAG: Chromosomal replication initiator protein DnaA [Gemmatimonadetes bacterium]|nr:Chromosomal replication initiator protein DnaA [Gemmatimonadota bacterium]